MKKKIKHWIAALLFVTTTGGSLLTVATPQAAVATCDVRLITIPAWYNGLTEGDNENCTVKAPPSDTAGLSNYIWAIGLNVVEMILQIVGYIAVGFIIYGGYKYMISAGSPDGMVKARKTIMNAVVGLLISIFSVSIVMIISGSIKDSI